MSDLRRLNRDLKNWFGLAPGDPQGRAHFRVAFSRQTEKRIGKVIKETESGIYLGTQDGVHTIPKYNYGGLWENPHWMLERLLFAPLPEVPDTANGSYEPIYQFPYVDDNCVLPSSKAVQLLINCLLYGARKTLSDYQYEEDRQFKKEIEAFMDILEDKRSYMGALFQFKEAVTVAKNYEGESPLIKNIKHLEEKP